MVSENERLLRGAENSQHKQGLRRVLVGIETMPRKNIATLADEEEWAVLGKSTSSPQRGVRHAASD